ncbi:LiaF transmembrane domain-containing protein [Lactobacillus xylocopicola]|uniref:Membrane protein n=1 Tax=Lactobacillus xylocopicola TaxID=2976676 RepID=A0ABN6SPX2_9LACO|nr:LiaF domain-containing protein [Lactobacillus xylocopicola]BDR61172.1 membrane protein [Lactobacillus xylocopicola]
MKKQKIKELLWGMGLVAAAAFLVLNQLHVLSFSLSLGTIFWTIIFGLVLVNSIVGRSTFGIVFSIAFLLIIYAGPLHITKIVPWTLLLAAGLIYAGLSLILPHGWRHPKSYFVSHDWSKINESSQHYNAGRAEENDRNIVISQKIGDTSRYVHSQNLESVTINSTIGQVSVYLDAAKPAGDTVTVNVSAAMGEVEIYLPLSWQIEDHLSAAFGEVNISGTSQGGGPTVILQGTIKFGEISIKYV